MKKYWIGLFLSWMALNSHAVIISGDVTGGTADTAGGAFVELTLPFNPPFGNLNEVGQDTFQSPNLYAFNEGQNIELLAPLAVNLLSGGGSGDISTGTIIASHYVFFDPLNSQSQLGFVTFDADILGVITSTALLAASDPLLINNNVNYLNPGLRGLENGDFATIDGSDSKRLNVDWTASSPGDFVRVITAFSKGGEDPCSTNPPGVGGCPRTNTVPEPATWGLFALGLTALGLTRRRKL